MLGADAWSYGFWKCHIISSSGSAAGRFRRVRVLVLGPTTDLQQGLSTVAKYRTNTSWQEIPERKLQPHHTIVIRIQQLLPLLSTPGCATKTSAANSTSICMQQCILKASLAEHILQRYP